MFVDVMMRRRARLDEPISALNAKLLDQFVAVPGFWAEGKAADDAPFEHGETGSLDLRKSLRSGLSGQVVYMPRFAGYLTKDVAKADDTLRIRLDTDKVDYAAFCAETLPQLIIIFGSYRGQVETDAKVRAADWEIVRHSRANRPKHRWSRQYLSHLAGVLVRCGVVPARLRHHRRGGGSSRGTRMRACGTGGGLRVADCDLGNCCRSAA